MSKRPDDIVEGNLSFVWITNANPAGVTQDGEAVIYNMGSLGVKEYKNARVGPPSDKNPSGVGIYILNQDRNYNYFEALFYSARQRTRMLRNGANASVVLIDGQGWPVLVTEMKTTDGGKDRRTVRRNDKTPLTISVDDLKSNFADAVTVYKSDAGGGGYQRLVNGQGQVTPQGQAFAEANDIQPHPANLRSVARIPKHF